MSEHKEYWPSGDPSLEWWIPKAGSVSPARNIDPLLVIPSALAHGQIGQVPWALVERGDGLVLSIGSLNVPIDTPAESRSATDMARALESYIRLGGWTK